MPYDSTLVVRAFISDEWLEAQRVGLGAHRVVASVAELRASIGYPFIACVIGGVVCLTIQAQFVDMIERAAKK